MNFKINKLFLSITLAITLSGSYPANAFLLPISSTQTTTNETNSSTLSNFLSSLSGATSDNSQATDKSNEEEKVPKVEVLLTPLHPKANDSVYAQALPQSFRNVSTNLYFSWYLYNPDPKVGSIVVKNGQKIFIPSNTTEGAFIRGAIAQVRGNYIPGVTPTAKSLGTANENSQQDRDGYLAHFGGDDGQGAIEEKIEDILGKKYDFNFEDFESNCKQNCDVEYSNAKNENDWKYNKCAEPTCGDWMDSCCSGAKNDYDACMTNVWDDLQTSCFDEICDKKGSSEEEDCYRTLTLEDYTTCNSSFFDQEAQCVSDKNLFCLNRGSCGAKPDQDCIECDKEYHNNQWTALKEKDVCEKQCEVKENNSLGARSVEPVGSRCFRYNFGGRDSEDHLAGIFQPITCNHYFPGAKNPDSQFIDWKNTVPFDSGDGSFKDDEEVYWGTDPSNVDTDGDGYPDEADIIGLGQQTLQFKYQSGDKIGVVVEGTSLFPTNDKTPYYKIMWGYSGICSAEIIKRGSKESPEFNSFCNCNDKKDIDSCKDSNDFGFGFLELNDIYQDVSASSSNQLDTFINITPQRPTTNNPVILDAITSGNEMDKDLLSYEWTLKHGDQVLTPENDPKNSRIVWKKQGAEAAYTELKNQAADFKNTGGIGWERLNLKPLIEGNYQAVVKTIETNGNTQKIGGGTLDFNVSDNLKIRFYRSTFGGGSWIKKDELSNNEAIPGDTVLAEYDGPFYDDFAWYLDRKKLEGSGPQVSLSINKGANTSYIFKLVATNKNRSDTAESETSLNIINPYVSIRLRGEASDNIGISNSEQPILKKNGLTYKIPIGVDSEFLAIRNPAGSSFSSREDLHYFWSFDQSPSEEGKDSYLVVFDKDNYLPETPHSLEVKVYSSDKKLIAQDKATLIPVLDKNAEVVENNRHNLAGLALVYLNIPDKLRFTLQTLLWTFFIYLLLSGIAWISPIKKRKNEW